MGHSVARLEQLHDVKSFDCGEPALNTWLQTIANQHKNKGLSQTFVLIDDESEAILGFYALAIRGITARESLPPDMAKKLPTNIPGYTLARLAISIHAQKCGYGADLLLDAIVRVKNVASQAGGPFLFVDAKNESAAKFYEKYGFLPLPGDAMTLVMSIL